MESKPTSAGEFAAGNNQGVQRSYSEDVEAVEVLTISSTPAEEPGQDLTGPYQFRQSTNHLCNDYIRAVSLVELKLKSARYQGIAYDAMQALWPKIVNRARELVLQHAKDNESCRQAATASVKALSVKDLAKSYAGN